MSTLATVHLLPGTDRVAVRDIPAMIADAIHGARIEDGGEVTNIDIAWAATVDEYRSIVKRAVGCGDIVPRNPTTLAPMAGAAGQSMLRGIVTIPDLTAFAAQFDIGVSVEPPTGSRIKTSDTEIVGAGDTATETPQERRAKLDITAERGARRRILEHWDSIEDEYGPNADGRQVLRVLRRDKGEDVPELKTVQNHLSKLRADKLIP